MVSKAQEEQLRVDKLFSLLSFHAAIFRDRLFNNKVPPHHAPICLMASPHENYVEICDRFWSRAGCTRFSVALEHFMILTLQRYPSFELSLTISF